MCVLFDFNFVVLLRLFLLLLCVLVCDRNFNYQSSLKLLFFFSFLYTQLYSKQLQQCIWIYNETESFTSWCSSSCVVDDDKMMTPFIVWYKWCVLEREAEYKEMFKYFVFILKFFFCFIYEHRYACKYVYVIRLYRFF